MGTERPELVLARRLAEARWALRDAVKLAEILGTDDEINAVGRCEHATAKVGLILDDAEARLDPDEESVNPWRRSAAAWAAEPEIVLAVERILEDAGGMLVHPANSERRGEKSLPTMLTELIEEAERHKQFPGGFDPKLLVYRALNIALALELVDAGSDEWLRRYGVEPERGEE